MVTKQEEALIYNVKSAPVFGLGKWRAEHGLIGEDWAAYSKAVSIKMLLFMFVAFFVGFELGIAYASGKL